MYLGTVLAQNPGMDTHSEPATTTETVTDLDIGLASGAVHSLVLREQDNMSEDEFSVRVGTINPREAWTFFKQHVAYICTRSRTISRPVATPDAIKKTVSA
jgi:hypothetical protein